MSESRTLAVTGWTLGVNPPQRNLPRGSPLPDWRKFGTSGDRRCAPLVGRLA